MNSGQYKKSTMQDIILKKNIRSKSPSKNIYSIKSIPKEKSNFCLQNKIFTKRFDQYEYFKNMTKPSLKINPIATNRVVNRSSYSAKSNPKPIDRTKELEEEIENLKQVYSS
jgi:hypothetical protein